MAADPPAPETPEAAEEAVDEGGTRAEQSVQAFRDALEKSVTISRERLQEVVDDAVKRGRMTRGDAEDLVSRLVTRGREQAEDVIGQLESVVDQLRDAGGAVAQPRRTAGRAAGRARRELEDATERARQEVGSRAESARKRAVGAVDQPLASADRVRRRARVPGLPITAYDQLSIRQIDGRLADLSRDELRKVRDYEQQHKARKGLLRALDRKLGR
jgi:polyhydroxyalkanoate synthesis regulator phasin